MKFKVKQLSKDRGPKIKLVELSDVTPEQGSALGKRIKALQDEREEKRQRVADLEETKVLNSDKVAQPLGFIAPEEDVENLLKDL